MYQLIAVIAVILAGLGSLHATGITHDPFKPPAQLLVPDIPVGAPLIVKEAITFKVSAILQAGKDSLVNVQGKTLQIGEQIDGFRLIQINERSAVFSKANKTFILKIDNADETTRP